jgi:hypothetical protein
MIIKNRLSQRPNPANFHTNILLSILIDHDCPFKQSIALLLVFMMATAGSTTSNIKYANNENKSVWGTQRAILNFTPGPQGCISPLGVNLSPRGELVPQG